LSPGTATYPVNSDCTGIALLHTFTSDVPLHFVVVNNGKQFYSVVNGNAINGVWTRLN
jgi:hypothetical protein